MDVLCCALPWVQNLPNLASFLPGRYALVLCVHCPSLRPPLDGVNHSSPCVINTLFCECIACVLFCVCFFASHGLDTGCTVSSCAVQGLVLRESFGFELVKPQSLHTCNFLRSSQ